MQALAYYVELIQYEPLYTTTIEPPYMLSTFTDEVTTTRLSFTTRPTTTSTPTRPWYDSSIESTTPLHRPGVAAPQLYKGEDHLKPVDNNHHPIQSEVTTTSHKPFTPQTGPLPILSVSNTQFFDWFLQTKAEETQPDPGICIY